jgi:hypothetical protein
MSYTASQAGSLVSIGGVDISTGVTMTTLKAPSGYTMVTPISTLVAAGVSISTLLPSGFSLSDLSSYDPQANSTSDIGAALIATGQQVLAVTTATATMLAQLGGYSSTEATTLALQKLASSTSFSASTLTDSTSLTTFLTSALSSEGGSSTLISAAAASLVSVTSLITTASVKSGDNLQYARLSQSSMLDDMKTLAATPAADLATAAATMQTKYTTSLSSTVASEA